MSSIFIDPSVISPGGSIKSIIALAIVDLPDPDSPTIPKISPLSNLNLTFLLATIVSFLVGYEIFKLLTSKKLIFFSILDLTHLSSNLLKG